MNREVLVLILSMFVLSCADIRLYNQYINSPHNPQMPQGWQGEYNPWESTEYSWTGGTAITDLLEQIYNNQIVFPHAIIFKIQAWGRYQGVFSDWRMIISDATGSIPVYQSGGLGLKEDRLGAWYRADVWAAEIRYGQAQLTRLSNLQLLELEKTSFFQVREWEPDGWPAGSIIYWTAAVSAIHSGTVLEVEFDAAPILRLDSRAAKELAPEVGDWLTVKACVSWWEGRPQVDMVNYHPGSVFRYVYFHSGR